MLESKIAEVDVEQLLARVDFAVKQHFKGAKEICSGKSNLQNKGENPVSESLPECPEFDLETAAVGKKVLDKKSSYRVADFTRFHDYEFVANAYQLILLRGPDESGLNRYLELLRKGKISKKEFLGRLRYSAEGRQANVKITGLMLPLLAALAGRLPGLGRIVKIVIGIASLPNLQRNLQVLENELYFQQNSAAAARSRTNRELLRLRDNTEESERRLLNFLQARVKQSEIREMQAQLVRLAQELNCEVSHTTELDQLYLAFEYRFRGSREEVKERLRVHLDNVLVTLERSGGGAILDLGCGRGEWLELLQSQGLDISGVDNNPAMVAVCQEKGLRCHDDDIFQYLQRLPDASCALISCFHVIEHLPPEKLVKLVKEIYRVLQAGGGALFESPNPENIVVGSCRFYYDITHRNPLPPATVNFIAEYCGFIDRQEVYLRPDPSLLKYDYEPHKFFSTGQDYAIWGWKK